MSQFEIGMSTDDKMERNRMVAPGSESPDKFVTNRRFSEAGLPEREKRARFNFRI